MNTGKPQEPSKGTVTSSTVRSVTPKKKAGPWRPEADEGELDETALETTQKKIADRDQLIRLSKGHVSEPDEQPWPQSERELRRERRED